VKLLDYYILQGCYLNVTLLYVQWLYLRWNFRYVKTP